MTQTYQTGFRTTLATKLEAAATSMSVATAPTVTAGRLKIGTGTSAEWVSYTGVSGTTLTGLTRGLSKTADPATAGTGTTHIAGTPVLLVAMHDQLVDKQQSTNFDGDIDIDGDLNVDMDVTIGNSFKGPVFATTAARDLAIPSPTNGVSSAYVTADGVYYDYQSGSWQQRANGATPNASTTVAGKVELATQAQFDAGTAVGETGASLVATPDFLQKSINTSTAKTTLTDTDLIGIADSADSGKNKKITVANFKTQLGNLFTLGQNMTALDVAYVYNDAGTAKIAKRDNAKDEAGTYYTGNVLGRPVITIFVDTNTIVTFYNITTGNSECRAGTISGTTITWGAPVAIIGDITDNFLKAVKTSTNKFCVIYVATTTSLLGVVGTVSGTTITLGTPQTINTGSTSNVGLTSMNVITIGTDKVVFLYNASAAGANRNNLHCATISGTVMTLGTEKVDPITAAAYTSAAICPLGTDKFLMTGVNAANDILAVGCTVSGTTITVDTANTTTYTGTVSNMSLLQVDTDLAIASFDETVAKAMYISVATTTATFGTPCQVSTTVFGAINQNPIGVLNSSIIGIINAVDNIVYMLRDDSSKTLYNLGAIDYDSTSNQSFAQSNLAPYSYLGNNFLVTSRDSDSEAQEIYVCNRNVKNIIGILQTTGVTSDSKVVATTGYVSAGHSNLVTGENYRASTTGTISLSPPLVATTGANGTGVALLGKAISTTQIDVSIPYSSL